MDHEYLPVLLNYNERFRNRLESEQSLSRSFYCLIGKSRKSDMPTDIKFFRATMLPIMLNVREVCGYDVVK